MKFKIKKIIKSLVFGVATLFSIFTCVNSVAASTVKINQDYISGIFHAHKEGSNYSRYGQMASWSTNDDKISFCIEPGAKFNANVNYNIYSYNEDDLINFINNSTTNSANKITQEQLDKIKLIAFYGYGYDNHNTLEYRIATQMLIWRVVDPSQVFTNTNCTVSNCKAVSDEEVGVADEMAIINDLVAKHYLRPSFDSEILNLKINESVSLNDKNGVLQNYEVKNCKNCQANVEGNNLIIKATSVGNINVTLTKKSNNSNNSSMLFALSEDSQNQVIIGDIDPVISILNGVVTGGSIEINKVDKESGLPLENVEFKVYKDNLEICTVTTNALGYAMCDGLDVGNYTLKEIKTQEGYILDETFHNFSISNDNYNIVLNLENQKIKGNIELYKISSSENSDALLKGAVYGIYNLNDKLITKLIVDNNGYAKYENLEYGNYYIKELEPSLGHALDNNIYNFSIKNNNETIKITSVEPVIKFNFSLIKTMGDGSSGVVETEANAKFDVYLVSSGEKVATLITDVHGKASITLDYGKYKVCQTSGNSNTLLAECFEIDLTKNDVEKVVNNEYIKAKLKVYKIDSNTGESINMSGIQFKIKNLDTDEYVCQTTNVKQCVFMTDEHGVLITPLPLTAGRYQLEEIDQKLDGYLWNDEPLIFIINSDNIIYDDTYGAIVEVEFANKKVTGIIEIIKNGEELIIENGHYSYEEVPLANVEFGLYDENGNLIAKVTTDANGYARFENLKLGKYILKELTTANDHILDINEYEIVLEYKDQYTPTITKIFTLKNYLSKGSLEFTKTDLVTGEALPNTKIEIFTEDNIKIFEGITDKNGKIKIDNLPIGKFYILESEAPDGYILNTEKMWFEITEDGQIVKADMTNELIIDVPITESNKNYIVLIACTSLILLCSGIVIYEKVKRKK